MKVQELIEMMNDTKVSSLKPEQLQAKLQKELEVKKYLGIKEKRELIETIIGDSIFYNDGIYKIDGCRKYVSLMMRCIEAYTNIELSDDYEDDYDDLCRAGILGKVMSTFDEEYQSVLAFLQMRCEYMLESNSLSAKLGSFLDNISNTLDNVIDTFKNELANIDPEKLDISEEDIKKLNELTAMFK